MAEARASDWEALGSFESGARFLPLGTQGCREQDEQEWIARTSQDLHAEAYLYSLRLHLLCEVRLLCSAPARPIRPLGFTACLMRKVARSSSQAVRGVRVLS